ncbi:hypothetical protein [Lyngbya sp. PCC 8106]|uniref:hypothetical protein n=1 Tax=Lyngbya sp. (strain PCC 8106) TaxID=313612 RepID=UPI0000EACBC3|nr:hypothetical protein [Lyngbya sp. PCC 8106]EAW33369.1 hypothetical protein L8106_22716 [Lyngbya sp. PCC 8106]
MGLGFAAYTPAVNFYFSTMGMVPLINVVKKANVEAGEILESLVFKRTPYLNYEQCQKIIDALNLIRSDKCKIETEDSELYEAVLERIPELIDLLQFVVDNECQLQLY